MGIKISELNPLETPADSDIIPIVDMDAGETKYIEFADLLGPEGPAGPAGADGEEVTIRVDGGYIQWRLGDGEWENLIAVSSLVGPQGEQGIQGPEGPAATLNWMGAWSALTEYDPLDVVSHEGVTYLCIATSTDDEPPDPVHWNAIGAGSLDADLFNRLASLINDTIAKGAPRAQDTPDMTIYVPEFQAYINGALVSFAGGNSPAMSAPSAKPRIDRVYLTDAGALAISTGAEDASPTAPALVANTVPICLVYHRVGSVHIDDADDGSNSYIYRDDRPLFGGVSTPAAILDTILTTRGDLLYRSDGTSARLAKGSQYSVLSMGADDPAWATLATLLNQILTTRGDLLYRGSGDAARLAKGSQYSVLSMGADDPAWTYLYSTRILVLPPTAFNLDAANSPEEYLLDGTNQAVVTLAFDDTTEETAQAPAFVVPADINTGGTITFALVGWAKTAAAGKNVKFRVKQLVLSSGAGSVDTAYSTASDSGDLACNATQNRPVIYTWTATVSSLGWSAGQRVRLAISRIAPSSNNLTSDFLVESFEVRVPTRVM